LAWSRDILRDRGAVNEAVVMQLATGALNRSPASIAMAVSGVLDPEGKKTALKAIIGDYNRRYSTNHDINNFDLYYQDVQQRSDARGFYGVIAVSVLLGLVIQYSLISPMKALYSGTNIDATRVGCRCWYLGADRHD
jgi:hypothetical protein